LETTSPEGLSIAAVSDREDPSELLLIRKESVDQNEKWNLKQNAIIGTSSARRKSQILAHRSDLTIKDLRGNVPTRINKLREGNYDAILLAKAGVNRLELDLSDLHCETLNATEFIPAPAQGVLGLQIRSKDIELANILSELNHRETQAQIEIERGVLKKMEGGCQLPLGVYCDGEKIYVSYSTNSSLPASYFIFENEANDLVNKIVGHIKSI
jgi:hydroxymethylbilane synthase